MTFAITIRFVTPDRFQSASRVSGEIIGVQFSLFYCSSKKKVISD